MLSYVIIRSCFAVYNELWELSHLLVEYCIFGETAELPPMFSKMRSLEEVLEIAEVDVNTPGPRFANGAAMVSLSPLMLAAECSQHGVIKILLERRPDILVRIHLQHILPHISF